MPLANLTLSVTPVLLTRFKLAPPKVELASCVYVIAPVEVKVIVELSVAAIVIPLPAANLIVSILPSLPTRSKLDPPVVGLAPIK